MANRATRSRSRAGAAGAGDDPDAAPALQSDDSLALELLDPDAVVELARRVVDIDGTYRLAAERMGQLYMYADSVRAHELTRRLDEPMRNASRNELMLRALLDELQAFAQATPSAAPRDKRVRARRGGR